MSKLEDEFAVQLKARSLRFEREVSFAEKHGRQWRADFEVWREPPGFEPVYSLVSFAESIAKAGGLLVEIQGTGPQGRHGSYGHHHSDCEKFATAAALGWRVLPLSAKMVKDGTGLALVEAALGLKPMPVYVRKPRRSSKVPKVKRSKGLPERVRKAAGL